MKIGCGTVNFRKYKLDIILPALREIGYEYFETQATGPWCPHVDVFNDEPQALVDLKNKYGFKAITGLWCKNGNFIANPDCVSSGIRCVEWAAAAGIPVVHMGDGNKPENMTDEDAWKALECNLAPVLEVARKKGVKLAIEPHGAFSLTGTGLKKFLTLGSPDVLGVNYDGCNVFRGGYVESNNNESGYKNIDSDCDELEVLKLISDRVVHVHAKDINKNGDCVALGTGLVKVKECIQHLKHVGYDGVISLETEGNDEFDDALELARQSFVFLTRVINE